MTYDEILIVCGVALAALGVLTLIIGTAAISSAKKKLKRKLYDKYGL